MVPYTGSISAEVIELVKGRSCVRLKDRRKIRNHLQSIHAVALMNLGEFSTGLAVMSSLPQDFRAILVKLEIEYFKKARGVLEARAEFDFGRLTSEPRQKFLVEGLIRNAEGDIVAKVKADWLIGPKEK